MKILIVDDNHIVRSSLKLLLSKHFEEVASIADPKLIPAILSNGHIDAILLDMNFDHTNLDGREGIFWLDRINECPNPPAIIMITAFGDLPLAIESMKKGALDFITKPWDNNELIEKIKNAISLNRNIRKTKEDVNTLSAIREKQRLWENLTLDEIKRKYALSVVENCNGNISAAAERLGVNRQTLYNLIKKS